MEISSKFLDVLDDMIRSTLADLFLVWFGGSLRCKLGDGQSTLTIALVLLGPLLALVSKSSSLSAGIHM